MTTAARGAFLIQGSTLFTPILSSLAGSAPGRQAGRGGCRAQRGALPASRLQCAACKPAWPCVCWPASCTHTVHVWTGNLSNLHLPSWFCLPNLRLCSCTCRPVWLGSLLAFVGTLIIAADRTASPGPDAAVAGGEAAAAAAAALPLGDALTLLAALCYSAATVRIPVWAVQRRVTPLQIAVGKAVALTAVAAAGLAVEAAQAAGQGQPLAALWPGWQQPEGWAILVWAALGPGALASVLHVKVRGWFAVLEHAGMACRAPARLRASSAPSGTAVGREGTSAALAVPCRLPFGRLVAAYTAGAHLAAWPRVPPLLPPPPGPPLFNAQQQRRPTSLLPPLLQGQSLVSPSAAQIVFCTVPVWSALLAAAALPGEPIGQGTWLGGAVVAAAGLVAARGKAARGGAGEPAPQAQQPSRKEDDMPS